MGEKAQPHGNGLLLATFFVRDRYWEGEFSDLQWLKSIGYRVPPVLVGPDPQSKTEGETCQRIDEEEAADRSQGAVGDKVFHLVQDKDVIDTLLADELPPEEYYHELKKVLAARYSKADPELLDHVVPLIMAFDVATVFAMSFGVSKFQLAQVE